MKHYLSPNISECLDAYCEACRNGKLYDFLGITCETCVFPRVRNESRMLALAAMHICGLCKIKSDPTSTLIVDILASCENLDCPLSQVILIRDWVAEYAEWEAEYADWEAENAVEEELNPRTDDTAEKTTKPKQRGRKKASSLKEQKQQTQETVCRMGGFL